MENASDVTTTATPTFATSKFGTTYNGHKLWIGCEAVLCFLTVSLAYLICCIARYALLLNRVSAEMRKNGSQTSNDRISAISNDQPSCNLSISSRNKYKRIMVYLCLMASIATFTKLLIDQLIFFYAWHARDDTACELLYDLTDNVLFFIAYLSVYGFLWMKQWLFYRDPAVIGILYNKTLVVFSKIFGPLVLLFGLVNVTINIIPKRFKAGYTYADPGDIEALRNDETYLGCISVYEYTDENQVLPLMSYAAITALFQTVLLGLFAYPILRQKIDLMRLLKRQKHTFRTCSSKDVITTASLVRSHYKSTQNTSEDDCVIGKSKSFTSLSTRNNNSVHGQYAAKMCKPSMKAMNHIKRAVLWTSICAATDVSLFIVFACLGKGTPLILMTVAQDIDIFLNIMCLVATYNTWRYILFPMCTRKTVDSKAEKSPRAAEYS